MVHGYVPYSGLGKDSFCKKLCAPVETVSDNPIEHFHQKGEFLHYPAVEVF